MPRTACRVVCFNGEKIAALRASVVADIELTAAGEWHKALRHPLRLAIMAVLAADEGCVVADLPLGGVA